MHRGYLDTLATSSPIVPTLRRLAASPWFAYGSIALFQFKVINGMWRYRDLPAGDTVGYFEMSSDWYCRRVGNSAWSPPYTLFIALLRGLSDNAYAVTIAHRLIIVFTTTILVLWWLRRVLPPSIAWLMAAWWAVAPATYDTLYEVHLFGALPALVGLCVVARKPTTWARGAVLAILLIGSVLIRTEFYLSLVAWGVVCLIYEFRQIRGEVQVAARIRRILPGYAVPLLLAVVVVGLFLWRSTVPYSDAVNEKHKLNVCQSYAFGYQQRHPEWRLNPMLDCRTLMVDQFGSEMPTMLQAFLSNPAAMAEQYLGNARLIDDGVQVLLFDATAGQGQPDYQRVETRSVRAGVMSLALFGTLASAAVVAWRKGRSWWAPRVRRQAWTWLFCGCTTLVTVFTMLTVRPRPSYLFPLFFATLFAAGSALQLLAGQAAWIRRLLLLQPVAAIALTLVLPSYFSSTYSTPHTGVGRPLAVDYARLSAFGNELTQVNPDSQLLMPRFGAALCTYELGKPCAAQDYGLLSRRPVDSSVAQWLTENRIGLFYINSALLADPAVQELLVDADEVGWQVVAEVDDDNGGWALVKRVG